MGRKQNLEDVAYCSACASKPNDLALYFSPNDLAERWRCSLSSVYRITEEAGFTRVRLGNAKTGKNSMIRYLREEVEAYETSRQFRS